MKNQIAIFSIIIVVILFFFTLSSCEKDPIDGDIVIDNELLDILYSESTDTLVIANQRFVLNTELYRNFFPGGAPRTRPLIAHTYIVDIDSIQIPDNIDVTKLYIVNNGQIWIPSPDACDNCSYPDFQLHNTYTDGPEWETNIYVDVIIKITDFNTSINYYLIAEDQLIYKVE